MEPNQDMPDAKKHKPMRPMLLGNGGKPRCKESITGRLKPKQDVICNSNGLPRETRSSVVKIGSDLDNLKTKEQLPMQAGLLGKGDEPGCRKSSKRREVPA